MGREGNAVAVTTDSVTQKSTIGNELELSATNVQTDIQKGVDLSNNSKVTSGSDESLVLAQQLQGMLANVTGQVPYFKSRTRQPRR